MAFDPRSFLKPAATAEPAADDTVPLAGTRAERVQRLQVGMLGIGAMVLLVGLADAITSRAQLAEASAVPEAAPTTEPSPSETLRDPLAEAGVAPDLPAEPETTGPAPGETPVTGDVPAAPTDAPGR